MGRQGEAGSGADGGVGGLGWAGSLGPVFRLNTTEPGHEQIEGQGDESWWVDTGPSVFLNECHWSGSTRVGRAKD